LNIRLQRTCLRRAADLGREPAENPKMAQAALM
jgi:hypothetical protein